jgi:hypothetical protein
MEGELFAILFSLFQLLTTPLLLASTIISPDPGTLPVIFLLLQLLDFIALRVTWVVFLITNCCILQEDGSSPLLCL